MARLNIPRYTPRATGTYICDGDTALDVDRIARECTELEAKGEDPSSTHPMLRYWRGEGRYDLDAVMDLQGQQVRPRDYIIGPDPELWTVRRLTWEQYNDVQRHTDRRTQALRACRLGVVEVEGSTVDLGSASGMLTSEAMQRLHDIDPELPVTLGYVVLLHNLPPTAAEKKP